MLTKKEAIKLVGKAKAKNRFTDELGGQRIFNVDIPWILSKIYGGHEVEISSTIQKLETEEYNRIRLEFLKQNKEREKRLARA